jgi:hypothetical protein
VQLNYPKVGTLAIKYGRKKTPNEDVMRNKNIIGNTDSPNLKKKKKLFEKTTSISYAS